MILRSRRRASAALATVLAVSVLIPVRSTAAESKSLDWHQNASATKSIRLFGFQGHIEIYPVTGPDITLQLTASSGDISLEHLNILASQSGDSVTACPALETGTCSRPNRNLYKMTVNERLGVPAGVKLIVSNGAGSISTGNMNNVLDLHTDSGAITFQTSQYADATVGQGSIVGSMAATRWNEPLHLRSGMGSVTVNLPAEAVAKIVISAPMGAIHIAGFNIPVEKGTMSQRATASLNNGTVPLYIESGMGSVTLKSIQITDRRQQ